MYRLKTQPGEPHDMQEVGHNGLLAATKAQSVANETGLVVVLERDLSWVDDKPVPGWVPDEVMFPQERS